MPNVYVEVRPKGRPEGSAIDDYVAEDHADHVLATFKTQREAIDWSRKLGHAPLVARVRHLNDKKKPDHWRASSRKVADEGALGFFFFLERRAPKASL